MKKLLFILTIAALCSSFGVSTVEEFSVLKVIGGIKHAKNNKPLYTGDKIFSNEKLTFANMQSKAALVNKARGRMMLQATKSGEVNEGLMPALSNVSSRAGALINAVDLKNHYADRYLILSGYEMEINANSFPMDEGHFFFLRYAYKGESISKKLSSNGNKLKMDASDILKIDGKAIKLPEGTQAELVYRDAQAGTSETIATFEPVFTEEKNLIKECKLIVYELGDMSEAQKKDHVLAYLTEYYGKPSEANFNHWIAANLNL